jgi:hypothetical protein
VIAASYFSALLAGQFDAVIHIDETRAVEPLERIAGWGVAEPPGAFVAAQGTELCSNWQPCVPG